MPLAIGFSAATANNVTVDLNGYAGPTSLVDVQVSTRPDFLFHLAPIKRVAVAAQIVVAGLNQRGTYFIRMRERTAAGAVIGNWTPPIVAYTPSAVERDVSPQGVMIRPGFVVVPAHVQTWLASNEQPGFPASNLANDAPADQWWSAGALPHVLEIETSGEPIDTIALLETFAPREALWTIKAGPSLANVRGAAPAFTRAQAAFHASPNLGGRPGYHALARLPAPQAHRFWRIEIAGTTGPFQLFVATYAVLGLARYAKNIAADKVESAVDLGGLERTRDGAPDRRKGFRMRKVDFEIALMTEAQWETQFADLGRLIGLTDPVLVVPNSKEGAFLHDRILFGPVSTLRVSQPYTARFTKQLSVESLI